MVDIRAERPADLAAISHVTTAAFRTAPHGDGTEAHIIDGLRARGALAVSLVAVDHGEVVGHVAFSRVTIADAEGDWYGLGPISVRPDMQGRGLGQMLVRAGLDRLRASRAAGCVVLGDPRYYHRFGFVCDAALTYGGRPSPYFQSLVIGGPPASGDVAYHPAFDA